MGLAKLLGCMACGSPGRTLSENPGKGSVDSPSWLAVVPRTSSAQEPASAKAQDVTKSFGILHHGQSQPRGPSVPAHSPRTPRRRGTAEVAKVRNNAAVLKVLDEPTLSHGVVLQNVVTKGSGRARCQEFTLPSLPFANSLTNNHIVDYASLDVLLPCLWTRVLLSASPPRPAHDAREHRPPLLPSIANVPWTCQ